MSTVKRKFVQLVSAPHDGDVSLFAVADDGTAWVRIEGRYGDHWAQLADLPEREAKPPPPIPEPTPMPGPGVLR